MTTWLAGGVFAADPGDEFAELRALVDDIGRRAFDAHRPTREVPFDAALWRTLEETGLTRLTSSATAGPGEAAVVLRGLARHTAVAPVAETDLLAGWLAAQAGIAIAETGPLTVALADAVVTDGRVIGSAADVPWLPAANQVLLAAATDDALLVAVTEATADLHRTPGHNLAGEPRDVVGFDLPADRFAALDPATAEELTRRGAWARCMQTIGALDAAAEWSVAHTRERVQFGRPLSGFQSVQHALSAMAGEIERARASATLAVAAAVDHGFASPQTDYAVTVAKVVLGRVTPVVARTAHQLHGAIGVTIEHRLWRATARAYSWADEFGSPTRYAGRLGRAALASGWDVVVGATDS